MRSSSSEFTSTGSGHHGRLGGELRERAHAALQGLDLVHHDLRGLLHESAVRIVVRAPASLPP